MSRAMHVVLALTLIVAVFPVLPAAAQAPVYADIPELPGCQGTTLASGARIAICMPSGPTAWNGDLIVYAHGYVAPGGEPQIPFAQLVIQGLSMPAMVTSMGYAFAVTSYRTNGLAVKNGVDDLVELQQAFVSLKGTPAHTYVVGVSEGGLVTTLAIEKRPDVFTGGLACCGPVGDFQKQMDYFGDFRVVYDYFYPDVLLPYGGGAMNVPPQIAADWEAGVLTPTILAQLAADPNKALQLARVTKLPYNPSDLSTLGASALEVLVYDVFATMDAAQKLNGVPFNNRSPYTWYFGSDNDRLLNRSVERFEASPAALDEIKTYYTTSGKLSRPLVTLHTLQDPSVPYWHEPLYRLKVIQAGSSSQYANIPIMRYGHCNFTPAEVIFGFALLVHKATGSWPSVIYQALPTQELQEQFEDLRLNMNTVISSLLLYQVGTPPGRRQAVAFSPRLPPAPSGAWPRGSSAHY